jgi:hypothetical protein
MDATSVREAIEASVASYIYHRWLQELGIRIEHNTITASQAVRLEQQVKEYVEETVKLDFRDIEVLTLDWHGAQAAQLVERIYMDAYSLLEA